MDEEIKKYEKQRKKRLEAQKRKQEKIELSKMVTNVKKDEKLYQDSIENLKKKKVKKNSKEKDILMLYQKYDEDFSNKIKEIIGKFIEFYKNLNESNRK